MSHLSSPLNPDASYSASFVDIKACGSRMQYLHSNLLAACRWSPRRRNLESALLALLRMAQVGVLVGLRVQLNDGLFRTTGSTDLKYRLAPLDYNNVSCGAGPALPGGKLNGVNGVIPKTGGL